jgi:L-methionine (R)-S-oxide reductase
VATSAKDICNEINGLRARGRSLDDVLTRAVELVHAANPRFHWTGIYELFPDNILRLGPFIGAPTNHVFICVGQGVCGSAVAQRKNMNIPDVTKASNYLACSQETKSELVVLVRKGERIFAQIDIDSHEFDAFDADAEILVEAVADCLADAYLELQTRRTEPSSALGEAPS